jgi:adenylate cyclase class 2
MREIEIKLRVKDLKSLEEKLVEKGCQLSNPIRQHDVIYSKAGSTTEWENAQEGDIIPRIRKEDDKIEFNIKQQRTSELDNIEYETKVTDGEAIHRMLFLLGWAPQIEVKKIRRKGKLGEYEICLDEVEELGSFVELEKLADDNVDPLQIQEELFKVLESLGLSRSDLEVKGYDTQLYLLHKKKD